MTSCTPYTFLYFVKQQIRIYDHREPYFDYLEQRGRLRLVCRAWNEFFRLRRHRWLQLDNEHSPMYKRDSTTTGTGGVRPVERLSMKITMEYLVIPILSWTSHILQRPANRSPLRVFALCLFTPPTQGYSPLDDLVGPSPKPPEYINTMLQSLSITAALGPFNTSVSISFQQISSTFTGLRSPFVIDVAATPQQTIALPYLELLYVHYKITVFPALPVHTWDTPALRHAHLGDLSTHAQFAAVLDGFLRRYAAQLESLVLLEQSMDSASLLDLPVDFWDAFSALRLLGIGVATLEQHDWPGWTVVPPITHPLRYVVCLSRLDVVPAIDRVRWEWTYHKGVKLVVGENRTDSFYLVNSVRDEPYVMKRTRGILPEL